jgi:transcriptional regulator with XRE-family HTH domain
MSPVQCQMARVALGWGVRDLARKAAKSQTTVVKFEQGKPVRPATVEALRKVLERGGIVFIPENGGGAGVRLAKRSKRK